MKLGIYSGVSVSYLAYWTGMGDLTVALFCRSTHVGLFGLASEGFWHVGELGSGVVFGGRT
jgi:hypothetical protein